MSDLDQAHWLSRYALTRPPEESEELLAIAANVRRLAMADHVLRGASVEVEEWLLRCAKRYADYGAGAEYALEIRAAVLREARERTGGNHVE